jgi:hypothetical protein
MGEVSKAVYLVGFFRIFYAFVAVGLMPELVNRVCRDYDTGLRIVPVEDGVDAFSTAP